MNTPTADRIRNLNWDDIPTAHWTDEAIRAAGGDPDAWDRYGNPFPDNARHLDNKDREREQADFYDMIALAKARGRLAPDADYWEIGPRLEAGLLDDDPSTEALALRIRHWIPEIPLYVPII